jgi:hypothetical protein
MIISVYWYCCKTREANISNSEKPFFSNTRRGLAIASLVLAVIAMFGVIPISRLHFSISCAIIDWTGCTNFDDGIGFLMYSWFFSIVASILAIILGFILFLGAEKGSPNRFLALGGILIGFIVWPFVLFTGIYLVGIDPFGIFSS